ncbi:MAG: Alpha/beta hydrolase family protein [Firmicutes bacterium ADurb.Bin182]|nr:MAG: Alpha/beta hydrolase family protein [Firmicutes bacterium ADurb.Bin182]
MRNLAVIFPGKNYNADKPLLYYARNMLEENGFETVNIDYGELPDEKMAAFHTAMERIREQLNGISLEDHGNIVFVSKSMGTVLAGAAAKELKLPVKHIYFTPVDSSLPFMTGEGIAFSGTRDPHIDIESLKAECKRKNISLYVFEGADHSLEVGRAQDDIEIQAKIAAECESFVSRLSAV